MYDEQTLQALTLHPDIFAGGPTAIVTGGGSIWMSIAGAPRWRVAVEFFQSQNERRYDDLCALFSRGFIRPMRSATGGRARR